MFGHIARKHVMGRLNQMMAYSYGELSFTTQLQHQTEFKKISTFRAMDLEGNLLDKNLIIDTELHTKVLRKMIFVDEMDSILLKVKSQGNHALIQVKYPST